MQSAQRTIGHGLEGAQRTLLLLTQWKDFYGRQPVIRECALRITRGIGDDDRAGQCARLAYFVKTALVYQADPVWSELVQSPDVLLSQIQTQNYAKGDCDDHVLLFCALAESLGIACTPAAVVSPGASEWDHVIAVVELGGRAIDYDLCAKFGPQPLYPQKLFPGA